MLRAGDIAVYDRAARRIRCVSCPIAPTPEAARIDPGIAGRSAREEHDRRVARREMAVKSQWGERIGRVILALTREPQSTRAWAVGSRGEERLGTALKGFTVLHDQRIPGTRANIDHIVIAPAGVFVVDAKHYKGLIKVRNRGWLLWGDERLYIGRRDRSALADKVLWQAAAVEDALLAAAVEPLPPVTPVLCFIDGDWPLIAPPRIFRGVRLESVRSLRRRLNGGVVDERRIAQLTRLLAAALPPR